MKKCKICKETFKQSNSLHVYCSPKCAIEGTLNKIDANIAKEKRNAAKELKQAKEAIKPLKFWADKAQVAFNAYIRERDGKVCISCGTTKPDTQYCAGHYRTRKAASQLRYNEDNVHTQCNNYCNMKNSGNIENYRPALIAKIGQERHDALINNHETKRWTKDELQEIERIYKLKLKELK